MESQTTEAFADVLEVIQPFLPAIKMVIGNYQSEMKDAARRIFSTAFYRGCNTDYLRVLINMNELFQNHVFLLLWKLDVAVRT